MRHIIPAYFLILLIFTSCATPSVREAREVLAECDSLRAAGQLYADSARLADIVTSLTSKRFFYPDDYAKANYYYGRLLLNLENEKAAMIAFTDVISLRSVSDNLIKGRACANIAQICSNYNEDSLAINYNRKAAEYFSISEEPNMQYFSKNLIAWHYAKKGHKEIAIATIDSILQQYNDTIIFPYIYESKVAAYYFRGEYDSTLIVLNEWNNSHLSKTSYYYMLKAQTHQHVHEYDSARHYASIVIQQTDHPYYLDDAYYILIQDTINQSPAKIAQLSATRADVHKDIRDKISNESEAIIYLTQSRQKNAKKIVKILFGIFCPIIILTIIAIIYPQYARKQLFRYKNRRDILKNEMLTLEKQKTIHSKEIEQQLLITIDNYKNSPDIIQKLQWKDYDKMCKECNRIFFNFVSLITSKAKLKDNEVRLCVLVLMDFKYKTISEMLLCSTKSIGRMKYEVAEKFHTTGKDLRNFLIATICQKTR